MNGNFIQDNAPDHDTYLGYNYLPLIWKKKCQLQATGMHYPDHNTEIYSALANACGGR
jgi:hypothetical protein